MGAAQGRRQCKSLEPFSGINADLYAQIMAANLTSQLRGIWWITKAVTDGDLTQLATANVRGEMLALKLTVNSMVGQFASLVSEVRRIAVEGTQGRLGGQVHVVGARGSWAELADNVNVSLRADG